MSDSGEHKAMKASTKSAISFSAQGKLIGKNGASSAISTGVTGTIPLTRGDRGKAIATDVLGPVMSFKEVSLGPHEGEVRFRLIHFWEARNLRSKVLIGLEMLLIDEEGTVIQGFIPEGRISAYLPHLKVGAIYRLNKFYGSNNKTLYRVAEPNVTITVSWNSVLSVLDNHTVHFPEDRFKLQGYREFEAASDLKGDLHDYVGHIKLVNGQVPSGTIVLDEAEIASTRRVLLHVQTHDDPVMKLYLWDQAASYFVKKFKSSGNTARVILVTALNPKRFGGVLSLCSMAPSRVFMDSDVEETRYYLSWLNTHLDVANRVNAEVVTKPETATVGELFSYMKRPSAKVAWFECTATIDDVVNGSAWFYIGCGVCHTKAIKGPTSLMCIKCGNNDIVGVPQYLAKLSVYDNKDQAVFVLLGDAGEELTGKKASELVENYYEGNENVGDEHVVPVPQALLNTIGETRKFLVKVSSHNLTGKVHSLTVTKVLPLEAPVPDARLGENVDQETGHDKEDPADELVKRSSDEIVSRDGKRAKSG